MELEGYPDWLLSQERRSLLKKPSLNFSVLQNYWPFSNIPLVKVVQHVVALEIIQIEFNLGPSLGMEWKPLLLPTSAGK